MSHILVVNRNCDLAEAVSRINDLQAAQVGIVILHHGLAKKDGLYTAHTQPVEVNGKWVYQWSKPQMAMLHTLSLRASGIKVIAYCSVFQYSSLVGSSFIDHLLAWAREQMKTCDGIYWDGIIPCHMTSWMEQCHEFVTADKTHVLHNSIDAREGGRAYWSWFDGVIIGEQACAYDLYDPYLTCLTHGYKLYLHPDCQYGTSMVPWCQQPWPESWIARGGSIYAHLKDLNWLKVHQT